MFPPVILDEGLSRKDQYKSLLGQLTSGLSSLKKLTGYNTSIKAMWCLSRSFWESFTLPWCRLGKSLCNYPSCPQATVRQTVSIIKRAKIKDHWRNNLLSVENLVRFDHTVMVYNIVNNLYPESLRDLNQKIYDFSKYKTKHNGDIIPYVNIRHRNKSF